MSMPNPDPLLVATWANEETIANKKGGAADARLHASEDFDAARLRGGPKRSRARSVIAWIRARLTTGR
jgi:hypothetical protein